MMLYLVTRKLNLVLDCYAFTAFLMNIDENFFPSKKVERWTESMIVVIASALTAFRWNSDHDLEIQNIERKGIKRAGSS